MEVVPWIYVSRCHQKLTRLRYVTSPLTNLHWYRHFSIQYEFYAAEQIQTIIKTESSTFSGTKFAWTYMCSDFSSSGTRVVSGSKKLPG